MDEIDVQNCTLTVGVHPRAGRYRSVPKPLCGKQRGAFLVSGGRVCPALDALCISSPSAGGRQALLCCAIWTFTTPGHERAQPLDVSPRTPQP